MLNLPRTAQAQALPPKDLLVLWDQDPAACAMLVRAALRRCFFLLQPCCAASDYDRLYTC